MAVNKMKLKTLNRLCEKGFDTAKKISTIEIEDAYENDLGDKLGGIVALKKAIKAHTELAWLCDGSDAKKEVRHGEAKDIVTVGGDRTVWNGSEADRDPHSYNGRAAETGQ